MGPCEELMTYLGVPGVGKWGLHSGRSGRLGLGRSKAFSGGVTVLASLQPGSAPLPGQALSWPRLLTCLTGEGSLACFSRLCGPLEGSCPAVPRAWWVWEAGWGPGMGARTLGVAHSFWGWLAQGWSPCPESQTQRWVGDTTRAQCQPAPGAPPPVPEHCPAVAPAWVWSCPGEAPLSRLGRLLKVTSALERRTWAGGRPAFPP